MASWEIIYSWEKFSPPLLESNEEETEESADVIVPSPCNRINLMFYRRLLKYHHNILYSQYQSAYLSTLGGAYHLCQRPHIALRIAMKQEQLGYSIQDRSLILKGKIFQAVNLILLNMKKKGLKVLKDGMEFWSQECNEDDTLKNYIIGIKLWLLKNYFQEDPSNIILNTDLK